MESVLNFAQQNKNIILSLLSGIGILSLLKSYCLGPLAKKRDLTGKVVIVTGATDGIGIHTTVELLKSGAKVVLACRSKDKATKLIESLDKKLQENAAFMELDLSNYSSVRKFVNDFVTYNDKLDILVNNAGQVNNTYTLTKDNVEQTFQVNTFSPILLTQELLPLLEKSEGRIVNVASRAHRRVTFSADVVKNIWLQNDWEYNKKDYGIYYQYAFSKLGNVFFSQYLNEYLKKKGSKVSTVSLHPGVIHTAIAKDVKLSYKLVLMAVYPILWLLMKTPYRGAQTTLHCCYTDDLVSGAYYKDCAVTSVAPHANNNENRDAYMEWARKMINHSAKSADFTFKITV